MSPHITSSPLRQRLSLFYVILLTLFLAVCGMGVRLSTAQSPTKEEREIEDKIPKHLPLKVKIKNVEKVKDLKNDNWGRDVEIEVQNIGDKPIYYLRLSLYFVDIKPEAADLYGWPLRYGRPDLIDIDNLATPDDVPIQPGGTYIFKVPDGMVTGWGKYRASHNLSHPKKIGLQFEVLSYGDGTGFSGTGGVPVPRPPGSSLHCGAQGEGGTPLGATRSVLLKPPPDTQVKFL